MTAPFIYRSIAALLLAAMASEHYLATRKTPNVEGYHASIREAAAHLPSHIGPWVGTEVPVIARAVQLLAPNVLISRRFVDVEDGRTAGILIVHCADAHDMVGHFPLRCYPADGWNLTDSREVSWKFGDRDITAMEYSFVLPPASAAESQHTITVENFLLRPNGKILRDMDSLSDSIMGAQGQASGAGQIQVYFTDSNLSAADRESIFHDFVKGYRPLIDAILADIPS